MFRRYSLKLRMQLFIGPLAVIAIAVTAGYAVISARNMERDSALARSDDLAARYSAEIGSTLNALMADTRAVSGSLGALSEAGVSLPEDKVRSLSTVLLDDQPMAESAWVLLNGKTIATTRNSSGTTPGLASGSADPAADESVQKALASGKEVIAEPRRRGNADGSQAYTRLIAPVRNGEAIVGAVRIDVPMQGYVGVLKNVGGELSKFGDGYMSLISNGGLYAAHPSHQDRIGKSVLDTDPWSEPFLKQMASGQPWQTQSLSKTLGLFSLRICKPITIGETGTPWAVWMTLPLNEVIMHRANILTQRALIMGGVWAVLLAVVVSLISRGLAAPLTRVAKGLDTGSTTIRHASGQRATSWPTAPLHKRRTSRRHRRRSKSCRQ